MEPVTAWQSPVQKEQRDFLQVRRKTGLLFQDSDDQPLIPTVADSIAFGPFNLGKSCEEVIRITAKSLRALGLECFEERITHTI
jgi:cobalt/nickel transport system ATP-binding protein